MASTINASTSSGLISSGDTSGVLQLQTANTTALTVDGSQNVGIGTTSPAYKLNVVKPSAGVTARFTDGDGITDIYGYGLEITRSAAYIKSSGALQLGGTTGYNDLVINASGNVALQKNISVGGATPTTSGTGITFPATQSASSDANTLDDYEEGTFTPTVSPNGGGSLTSYNSGGSYIKIGRNVFINGFFTITNAGTAAGTALIAGLPFNTQNTNGTPNRTSICIVREDSQTGLFYAGYTNYNSAFLTLTSLTNGAIVWTNSYTYIFTTSYISAS